MLWCARVQALVKKKRNNQARINLIMLRQWPYQKVIRQAGKKKHSQSISQEIENGDVATAFFLLFYIEITRDKVTLWRSFLSFDVNFVRGK